MVARSVVPSSVPILCAALEGMAVARRSEIFLARRRSTGPVQGLGSRVALDEATSGPRRYRNATTPPEIHFSLSLNASNSA